METLHPVEPVDVIVPVYNEEEILPEFHRRITALNLPLHLIYVDNASSDRSVEIISSFGDVTLIRHEQNEGYGGSILDGIAHSENDKIVIIDADCEYPPEALPELIERLDTSNVVYTSRFLEGRNQFMPLPKRLGNQLISALFNLLFRQRLTDLYTGCKAFNRAVVAGVRFERKGFEHVLEFGVRMARRKLTIEEIAIDFTPRHTGQAKMQHISETLKYLYLTCYYYLKR
ncbi:glycosyltransferase family 2 protein [Desulfogranum mediterraneum]|uniref:glycosyltransferase family 2 protein n=1 Tax=Desulfogranum mediterraneum TaxID=160661 RepID=UPI00041EE2BD|nr:glycosyltransferase family 2 protein [Desulfogranum mediterraneum]